LKINKELSKKKNLNIIINLKNEGFCKGNNIGINQALQDGANYIFLLNNDVRLDKKCLTTLYKKITEKTKTGAVSPKIYFEKNYEYHKDRYTENQKGKVIWAMGGQIDWKNMYGSNIDIDKVDSKKIKPIKNPDFLSGCSVLIKSKVFKKVGLFDENFYLYFEDVDLSKRIIDNGFDLVVEPKAKVWHINSGSSGANNNIHEYFITRNRLYFASKYASFRTQFALLRESLRFYFKKNQSPWKRKAIRDYFLSNMEKGSWK